MDTRRVGAHGIDSSNRLLILIPIRNIPASPDATAGQNGNHVWAGMFLIGISMKGNSRLFIALLAAAVVITAMGFYFHYENNSIVVTRLNDVSSKLPDGFNGYVIVQISDLHNKEFGRDQKALLDKLEAAKPDCIVVTGDLIDRRKFHLDVAMEFINGAVKIAPVYYVSGNHEAWSGRYAEVRESLVEAGVCVLDNAKITLKRGNDCISLIGLSDPGFYSDTPGNADISLLSENLMALAEPSTFKILLCHRPELLSLYAKAGVNLVFAGHAHGGQIRLPLIGALYAPDQGLFPRYTSGSYHLDQTTEIVSRGLGNSLFPVRIGNRPEIVVVTLKKE